MFTLRLSLRGTALVAAGLAFGIVTAQAGPLTTTILSDNFSGTTVNESETTVDSNFFTLNSTNVDVLGNIGTIPSVAPVNLVPFEGICAASNAAANCVDLNGTSTSGGGPQATLETVLSLGAGTYNLGYDLLGASGFLSDAAQPTGTARNISTSTLVLFGNLACITSHTGCIYMNTVTLGPTDTNPADGNISVTGLSVSGGTDYIAFVSEQTGMIGSLLTDVSLTENVVTTPEPGTMVLLGTALLGLGGLGRLRARKSR